MRMNIEGVIGEVTSLPGCGQIAVSHGVYAPPALRGNGFGHKAHNARLLELKRLGYDAVICTMDLSNCAQLRILEAHGWHIAGIPFKSSKTGHSIQMWMRADLQKYIGIKQK